MDPSTTILRKTPTITIVEEPSEDPFVIAEETMAVSNDHGNGVAPPKRDYYNSGSTEDATDTPLVINRLEAVRLCRFSFIYVLATQRVMRLASVDCSFSFCFDVLFWLVCHPSIHPSIEHALTNCFYYVLHHEQLL
jgi:hypothetical protein